MGGNIPRRATKAAEEVCTRFGFAQAPRGEGQEELSLRQRLFLAPASGVQVCLYAKEPAGVLAAEICAQCGAGSGGDARVAPQGVESRAGVGMCAGEEDA